MKFGNKYLFISFSVTKWDGPWYVRQKLMHEFSKDHRVIYVNPRMELRQIIKNFLKLNLWRSGLKKVNKNLIIIEPCWLFPKIYKLKRVDNIIDYLFHLYIKMIAAVFGRNRKKIIYLWEPEFSSFRKYYKKLKYIFHPYDLFEKYTYANKNNPKNISTDKLKEEELVNNAFLFYTVSEKLCDYYDEQFKRRPKLLTNAVSDTYFGQQNAELYKKAKELTKNMLPKKIVYSGSIKGSLNIDIIMNSASELKDYTFVFIGHVRYSNIEKYDKKLLKLFSIDNVVHIDSVSVSLLVELLRQMDILTLIYSNDQNIWTYYGGPAKLFEYMAFGKPIISTPHPALNPYRRYIKIVDNSEQFISAIKKKENEFDPLIAQEMKQIAKKNTWEIRKNIILEDIQ